MKSVLNISNNAMHTQPMFLGEDLSIQRYDKFKYKKFFDLWNTQMTNFWRPEEVSLLKSRSDYEKLSNTEKFIFDTNLKWQTMTDSMLSRSINSIAQYITNPELEICCTAWANFETIHSYSYTYILQNVVKDASRFFDSILEDKEIVNRARATSEAYDKLIGAAKNPKQEIFDAVIATQITEGLAFYISFACSFFFGYRGMMEGNAKIIGLIARDENCLTQDAEILTKTGWKKIIDLTPDERVAQYTENGKVEFVKTKAIIKKDYSGKIYKFRNKENHVNISVTPDHRMIFKKNGTIKEETAENFKGRANCKIPVSANNIKKEFESETAVWKKILAAIEMDSEFFHRDTNDVMMNLNKKHKISILKSLLDSAGIEYSENENYWNPGYTAIYFRIPHKIDIRNKISKKTMIEHVLAGKCNEQHSYQDILDFIIQWNGDTEFNTTTGCVDFIQAACVMAGRRTHLGDSKDPNKPVRISIIKTDNIDSSSLIKSEEEYNGKVVCVSVPSGMFVARQDGKPFITGNCHVAITQNIIENWRKYEDEGFQSILRENEQKIYDMYGLATEIEKEWADYLFSNGSLLGLTPSSLKGYIEWLANNRLASLGYKKIYDAPKNPIGGWLDSYMDSSKIQVAPQETEISSYKISARNPDMQDSTFEGVTL